MTTARLSLAFVLPLALLALANSCKDAPTTPTPEPQRTITLAVADSSLREIWLRLSLPDSLAGRTVKLFRNDALLCQITLARRDTVVMDSGLALGASYAYRAIRYDGARTLDSANLATATMPATSHAFAWRIDTLGTTATWLNDVCVINDTCIWVVGYFGDQYNAARFDGQQWHYESLRFAAYGTTNLSSGEINAVWGFSPNDVWMFSSAGSYLHWNGSEWKSQYVSERSGGVLKIWGTSGNDLYFVGTNGSITYYNGTAWRRVESGTTVTINDVWGSIDRATGDTLVLCRAIFNDAPTGRLLRLNKHRPPTFFSDYPPGFYSLWFRNKTNIFGSGTHLYWRTAAGRWIDFLSIGNFKRAARGTAENDIYFVGDFGTVVHYDGQSMRNFQANLPNWRYAAVSCKGRTMCAVGWRNGAGSALIGHRQ